MGHRDRDLGTSDGQGDELTLVKVPALGVSFWSTQADAPGLLDLHVRLDSNEPLTAQQLTSICDTSAFNNVVVVVRVANHPSFDAQSASAWVRLRRELTHLERQREFSSSLPPLAAAADLLGSWWELDDSPRFTALVTSLAAQGPAMFDIVSGLLDAAAHGDEPLEDVVQRAFDI